MKSLNKGKAPDVYSVIAEHLVEGAERKSCTSNDFLLNHMLRLGIVPDSLKLEILTPVCKKKGSNLDSKNYRGTCITVNPTITKVLETNK